MPYGKITLNDGNEIPEIAFGTGTALFKKAAVDATVQVISCSRGFDSRIYVNDRL